MTAAPITSIAHDPRDSTQNGWVQDWLTKWAKEHIRDNGEDDWHAIEVAIELIQETWGA